MCMSSLISSRRLLDGEIRAIVGAPVFFEHRIDDGVDGVIGMVYDSDYRGIR